MSVPKSAIYNLLLSIPLCVILVTLFIIGTNYISRTTFTKEGITKGVLRSYHMNTKSGSYFTYYFTLDREYYGYTSDINGLRIGDTIDIIYDLSDSTRPFSGGFGEEAPSYSAVSRYYPIIGHWGFNVNYKKFKDKIESSKDSKIKYLGTLP